jgi:hypothetical protein
MAPKVEPHSRHFNKFGVQLFLIDIQEWGPFEVFVKTFLMMDAIGGVSRPWP